MPPTRIVQLATTILEHTQKVDSYLAVENIPTPSFEISCPPRLALPASIQESQHAVVEASDELMALMLGPAASLTALHPHNSWTSLQAIQRLGIANSFSPSTTSTFSAIAQACSQSESDIRRLLRHAMTYFIFQEPSPGIVAHTASSKALAEIPQLGQLVGFMSSELWPSATRLVDALEKWPQSEEPNETGYSIAYSTDKPMFEFLAQYPERAQRMAKAMSFMNSGPGYSPRHILENFDWGDAANGLLVDVGGGQGIVAIEIARHFPRIKCIVQDLPEVIEGVSVPDDLAKDGRLMLMPHDFFQEQVVKGADVYYLRWILHDWSDKYATEIIRQLVPALKRGARILVSELCLPDPCVLSRYKERHARNFDISMKQIQNSKERDATDWAQLFAAVDMRFQFGVNWTQGKARIIKTIAMALNSTATALLRSEDEAALATKNSEDATHAREYLSEEEAARKQWVSLNSSGTTTVRGDGISTVNPGKGETIMMKTFSTE
ncbi:hypothetical protein G7Y89_g5805 [Cudoniella acicularis]|uniref:O-methyltransferase C-terminal domain-containing protein n=1 Tax=Cudoniella acicularis TaxID=354080 RepID=A0A8H4W3M6_9HELO|nr:hypothetical protein G7Y89_g5805 [Cudoniella acicularis]